jgi:2-aminoethylphosphonate aminotransferase
MAQVVPDICPREQEFVEVMDEVRQGLLDVVAADDEYTCIILAGSGTAAMDAVINSAVPPNKKIMVINNGAYGERMVKIARAYNIDCVDLAVPWTEVPDLAVVESSLRKDSEITHVAIVHHETTTGTLNPIREIGEVVHSLNKLVIADTISSFAGIPLNIQNDHIDYLMSTSNKCIQGMAGVCFVICKKSEIEKTANYLSRSFYLNLYQQYKYFEEHGEMQFTPPVQVIYALRQAIKEYFREGSDGRHKRYCDNWRVLTHGLRDIGFTLLLADNVQSHILTTVVEPDHPNFNFHRMHDLLHERGFTIYPGKIGDKNTFRIANMGEIDSQDINNFIVCLKEILGKMKVTLK